METIETQTEATPTSPVSGYDVPETQANSADDKAAQAARLYPNQSPKDDAVKAETKGDEGKTPEPKPEPEQEDTTGYVEKPVEKSENSLKIDTEGLDETTVKEVQEFSKANGLSETQAQAVANKYKEIVTGQEKAQKDYDAKVKETYKTWEEDLRRDQDFGGANFAKSVHNVNKLINEMMPGFKNMLTSNGKRLPPSVMKDLNSIAKRMYGESKFNEGEQVSSKDTWKPTDFYKT